MATEVKRRRGTTSEHASFTGAVAELTVDLTKDTVVVHDGATQAGFPLLREDFSNAIFTVPDARYLLESNNLSDLDNVSTARDNLELGASDDVTFNTVTADLIGDVTGNVTGDVTGDLTGAIHVQGKNDTGGTLTKGTPVYISGQVAQGQQFTIGVADSDGSGTMPSIGVLSADVNDNAMGDIVTHGKLIGIDTSSFTVGDELFIGPNGTLVNTPPTGESNLLQKIAKVIRVDGSSGQIYIMGAGRTNAVPNLDEGKIFAGDANNQAVTTDVIDVNIASGLVTINDDLTVNGIVITDEIDTTSITWNTSTLEWDADPSEKFNNPVFIGTSLDVDNGINADQHVHAGTYLKADTYLEVGTNATIGGTLSVTGNTTISGTLDAPTLNTGQGDNELYAMNQNVQTSDSVTFGALTVSGATILSSTLQVDGTITVNDDIETADFSSWFTTTPSGFQISQAGVGDFRTLYIDELVAKAFTADVAQALAGSDILTKSVAKLNASFVVPSVGASVSITVEDLEGLSGLQVFEAGDHVRARVVDSTSGLEIFDIYGTVSNYASVAGGTQTWDYTITYAGASNGAVGKTVNKGNILLDYGTSGSYYIERTVLDRSTESSDDFTKVPYNRIVQWTNTVSGSPRAGDPDTVITVITQSGNLANLTSTYSNVSGFGFFGENTFLTGALLVGDLTRSGQYMEFSGSTLTVKGDIDITGTTIFKSAKDGSTTPTNLGEATFIDGGTIVTDSITATEINVSNLFAQEIEVTGKLKATDGSNEAIVGKLENIDINVQASQGGVSNGDFYGFFINANNYFGISDGDLESGNVLRVGDATNFLEFDGTNFTINASTFDLTAGSMTIDSTDGITIGANDFFKQDKTFSFGGGVLSGDSDTVLITTTNFNVNTDNQNIVIGTGSALMTVGKLSSVEQGIKIDSGGITNQNYWKLGQGDVQFKVGDGTNFLSFNENAGTFEIKSEVFDLTSGNLRIKSTGTTYPSDSANTEVTTSDVSDFRLATLANGFNTNSLAINNNRWVKFQFDYSQSVPAGSFTAGITVTLEVSTNNSTFTDYGLFSDTRIDFNTNYFVADNATGNRLNVVDQSDSTKTEFKFTSSQTGSCTGTITMYFYVNEKDTTTHIRFNVLDSSGVTLSGASATDIGTRDYNPVTELNPSGVFTRLSDSLILSNGNTYIDYSLIT
jgi:hypothetical protein